MLTMTAPTLRVACLLLLTLSVEGWTSVQPQLQTRVSPSIRRSPRLDTRLQIFELTAEEEDLIRRIRGPMGATRPRKLAKVVLIFSDRTGVTARAAVEKSLEQFNGCDQRFFLLRDLDEDEETREMEDNEECVNLSIKEYPFMRSEQEIAAILKRVKDVDALIVFTMAETHLRESMVRMCELAGLRYVDLLGSMFDAMSTFFEREPIGVELLHKRQVRRRALSDDYFRRIEAVEYTLACDDGMKPRRWKEADVILLGVSRTGKTPLSVVLAQTMGLKVANVPLVVDLPPPRQLFQPDIDPRRVFCLTLHPDYLQRIRHHRIRRELQHSEHGRLSNYSDPSYLDQELKNARKIAVANGFTEIDVTGKAVEETASLIRSHLNDRFPDF
jgi:regulator of PEP synthase PpsR (kinase-PPPase family)